MASKRTQDEFLEESSEEPVSKSQRKRTVEALQKLGGALVELEPAALKKFDMPENLRDALIEAQKLKANGARRRQLQYIGRLMREVDGESIQQQLEAFQDGSQTRKRYDRLIESWRERLLNDSNGLTAFMVEYPEANREELFQLINDARTEIQKAVPTPKAFRQLYRDLKKLIPFSLIVSD